VRLLLRKRNWGRVAPAAWQQLPVAHPITIAGCISVSVLNVLWRGHGVLRTLPAAARFAVVAASCYAIVTITEFLWLLATVPQPVDLSFPEEPTPSVVPEVDPLVEQLRDLAPSALKEETLQLADEMRTFEAGSDGAYVNSLLRPRVLATLTEEERDNALDRESTELIQSHLATWRIYRERFYRPARAFRDELRKRLGIKNPRREPEIPALDQAALVGPKPITEAADHLTELANRLN
jgi:hypothetical protein